MNQQTIFKQTEIGKIPEDWEVKKIENLCDISSSKRIFYSEYVKKGIPFYRSKEIIEKSNGNHISTELFISTEKYEEIKNKYGIPIPGDLLLTSVGTLGIPYIVQEEDKFYFKDGNLTWFKNFKNLNVKYLYYWFNSKFGKDCLNAISIGSTQKALTIKALKNIDLIVPPLPEQHAIAKILSDLDSKIELLQKQNETLEAIAQVLFKHWFVDFEFPNGEGKPYKSSGGEMVFNEELGKEIPKEWGVGRLGEFINITSGKRPEQKSEVKDSVFNVPLVGASRVMGFVMDPLFKEPVLIIGRVGTHGVVQRFTTPTYPSDNTLVIRSPFYEYVYQVLKRIDYASLNVGSTQPLITQSSIKNYSIIISEKNIRINFENTVSVLFAKRNANNLEIESLSQIRDTFHPKLMSGEVRVNK